MLLKLVKPQKQMQGMNRILIKPMQPCIDTHVCKNTLQIAEFFTNTTQGEGVYTGAPATFLRLAGCTLKCPFCDTLNIWQHGNHYRFDSIIELLIVNNVNLQNQHLVITGGSPLLQQKQLVVFIEVFIKYFGYKPFIEIENECVIKPLPQLIRYVDCWNNSPKLKRYVSNAYKPDIIKTMSTLENSWFKFVVSDYSDWLEIENEYIKKQIIKREQILLMPLACNKTQLERSQKTVVDIAIKNNVRYSNRLHIQLWGSLKSI